MLKVINDLAKRIEQKWSQVDNSVYAFPDVVMGEIDANAILQAFEFTDIYELLKTYELKNVQISSEFSELHLKLFDNGKFYIEVLNWWDRDTSIHDHGFSGVIVQLSGSALNAMYGYEQRERVSHNLKLGQAELINAFVSKRGDVRPIPCGREEKHAVLHLEQPTISLIVRTHPVAEVSPQLNYFPPFVLVDHSATGLIFNKRLKYFKLLHRMDSEKFKEQAGSFLAEASATEAFWFILKQADFFFSKTYVELLADYSNGAKNEDEKRVRDNLISSAASRFYSQFLIDRVKPKVVNPSDRLLISCLAASYSRKDFTLMAEKVGLVESREQTVAHIRKLVPAELLEQYDIACRALSV